MPPGTGQKMGPQTSVHSHFDFVACCLELISDDCSCAELHTGDSGVNWRLNPGVEIPVNPSQRGACHPQSVLEAKCVSNHSTTRRR